MPTTEQLSLIEQRVANEKKSTVAAYVLWWLFGMLGAHNFYLGSKKIACAELFCSVGGWLLLFGNIANATNAVMAVLAFLALIAVAVLLISDLFLIPGRSRAYRENLRKKYTCELERSA